MEFHIRDYEEHDFKRIRAIAASLKEWFNETGLKHMGVDFCCLRGLVAESGGIPVGFLFYCSDEGVMYIRWMGVERGEHRKGVGRMLISHLQEMAKAYGIDEIRVETLGDSVEYEPYARTRAFWRACGFADFKRIMQDNPEWPERLVLHKKI